MTQANRLGLDYRAEASKFTRLPFPIFDVHSHINGTGAAKLFGEVCDLYGVGRVYSMTHLEQAEAVRNILGERIQFIAIPNFSGKDRKFDHGAGYIERIKKFHKLGSRIVKFWAAPRAVDYGIEVGDPNLLRLNSPNRVESMKVAFDLGMKFMVHVGDPDTWFKTKYADVSRYGTKASQYEPFEELLERFPTKWIAAHMGGSPEDLEFLSGMLSRHPNLYLDTSATKWQVRELSKHPQADFVRFFDKWRGRLLFGSDIVTSDEHLNQAPQKSEMGAKASDPDEAFDLYASRYWALRTLFESKYLGESPIADPDLHLVEPKKYTPLDAPKLVGRALDTDLLKIIYHDAAANLLG